MKRNTHKYKRSGQGLVILIILVLLALGGWFYLDSHKRAMDKEARVFGHDAINRIVLNYDTNFLANNLSPQMKLQYPPSEQNALMNNLRQLGQPAQPFKIDENITWESHFFEPHGTFTAHLNYPAGPATLEIAVDHPVSKWQIANLAPQFPSQAR
jgi:hypothetical protein